MSKTSKNLSCVLAALRRAQQDPRIEHVHEVLRKAHREFEVLGRSGRLDKDRLFRATKMLCDGLVAALHPMPEGSELRDDSDGPSTDDT